MLYRNLSPYLIEKYGCRVFKICIDGGFTCPNRDGNCGRGGCIFCGERGAGEHIRKTSVRGQIDAYFRRERKAGKFIAYFQNFTNTYAPVPVLKERYDEALSADDRIAVLSVGTRPDCITEEIASLLASYKKRADVWVELGLQTANDQTADRIHRGYHREAFDRAVRLLNEYGLPVVAHVMIGLPGEGIGDVEKTVDYLNGYRLFGIKIHSLYVTKDTLLARMYERGEYAPISMQSYAEQAAAVIARLSPDVIVHKITGDAPKALLIAPEWNLDKNGILNRLNGVLKEKGWFQGCLYQKT